MAVDERVPDIVQIESLIRVGSHGRTSILRLVLVTHIDGTAPPKVSVS